MAAAIGVDADRVFNGHCRILSAPRICSNLLDTVAPVRPRSGVVYHFEIAKSPRVLLIPAIVVVLAGASLALAVLVNALLGLVALGITIWVGYHFLKAFRHQLASRISTTDEGITCYTSVGEKVQMEWAQITLAGRYLVAASRRLLFLYDDANDRLIKIPPQFSDYDQLEGELAERVEQMLEIEGDESEDVEAALRGRLNLDQSDPD